MKYDNYHVPPGVDCVALYQRMGQALRSTGRPILFRICEWGHNKPWEWGARVGGHIWCITGDIDDCWESLGLSADRLCCVIDLCSSDELGVFQGDFSTNVDSHDVVAVRLIPQYK